jgi:hypothetical protein
MERNPQSIVFSMIGRINVLAGTDQIENVWKIDTDTGNVDIVQLIVGITYCSNIRNFLFWKSFSAIFWSIGEIYTKPNVADKESWKPIS